MLNKKETHPLIGISGKAGSGKDTVAKILLVRFWSEHSPLAKDMSVEGIKHLALEALKDPMFNDKALGTIKRFADPLKNILCEVLNCTREDLEDREFKEKVLGEEWDIVSWVIRTQNTVLASYNDRTEAEAAFSFYPDDSLVYLEEDREQLTVRDLITRLGTEAGRQVHPNIWVNALFSSYLPLDPENRKSDGNILDYSDCTFPSWIIPDVRFKEELYNVSVRGGIVIRVNRRSDEEPRTHTSETALDNEVFALTIDNNGSLADLIETVFNLKF